MLLKYNTTLLFIFSLFVLFSCTRKQDSFVQQQIERAIEIGEEQPEQALSILDSIQKPVELSQKNYMLYQIADVRANRNLNNLIREDQTKSIVEAAAFFEKKRDVKNAFLANYYAARAYKNQYSLRSNTDQGLRHYLKAYYYAKNLNDSLNMGKTLYNIGLMYAEQNIFDSTTVYLKDALPLLKNNTTYLVLAYRLLGLISYTNEDNEKALFYLDKGEPLLKDKDNIKYTYLYNALYGIIYQDNKQYDKAIYYLGTNMTDSIPEKERVRTALNLIEIYTASQKLDSANYYLKEAEIKLNIIQEDKLLLFGYMVLKNYYLERGNTLIAREYTILFNHIQDIINKQNEAETLFRVDKEVKIQQLEKAQEQYPKTLYIIILSIIIIISVLLFILKRLNKKRDKLINQYDKIKEDLEKE